MVLENFDDIDERVAIITETKRTEQLDWFPDPLSHCIGF